MLYSVDRVTCERWIGNDLKGKRSWWDSNSVGPCLEETEENRAKQNSRFSTRESNRLSPERKSWTLCCHEFIVPYNISRIEMPYCTLRKKKYLLKNVHKNHPGWRTVISVGYWIRTNTLLVTGYVLSLVASYEAGKMANKMPLLCILPFTSELRCPQSSQAIRHKSRWQYAKKTLANYIWQLTRSVALHNASHLGQFYIFFGPKSF